MGMISWSDESFQVQYGDETVTLLPKEYALFHYLYTWKNRTFSRQELLDRVWPLEEPTDRTVDDHIYRLRRKLQKWSPLFTIDTVRGVGYRLNWKQSNPPQPTALNREFSQSIRTMLETYHGLGMGAAMQTLYAHREVLGFSFDPYYDIYLPFISGDFAWLVENTTIPMPQKLFYLFHIFYMAEVDPHQSLRLLERVQTGPEQMPAAFRNELDITAIGLYAMTGQYEKAEQQLAKAQAVVDKMDSNSFTLFLYAQQTLLALLTDRLDEAESLIRRSADLLTLVPMQRELGSLTVQQGLALYLRQDRPKARKAIDQGMEVIRSTKFVPHLIYAVHIVLFFLKRFDWDAEWERKYDRLWSQLASEYQLDSLKKSIVSLFSRTI